MTEPKPAYSRNQSTRGLFARAVRRRTCCFWLRNGIGIIMTRSGNSIVVMIALCSSWLRSPHHQARRLLTVRAYYNSAPTTMFVTKRNKLNHQPLWQQRNNNNNNNDGTEDRSRGGRPVAAAAAQQKRIHSDNEQPHPQFSSSNNNNTHNNHAIEKATLLVQAMIQRIRAVNEYPQYIQRTAVPFYVDGAYLGLVRPAMADRLHATGVFCKTTISMIKKKKKKKKMKTNHNDDDDDEEEEEDDDEEELPTSVGMTILTLNEEIAGTTCESRTQAVASVTRQLCNEGIVTGWRNELYPIQERFDDISPVFLMERAAVSILGAIEYGVHINGLVVGDNIDQVEEKATTTTAMTTTTMDNRVVKMWLARRSLTKSKYPGFLDHIVAGGQPYGISLYDNVIKECHEEAGIPIELVTAPRALRPAGAISYQRYNRRADTIERVVLFNYDLYLPRDFVPTVVDGEVQEFVLYDMAEIGATMDWHYHDPIKPNCYVVIIDFLLRHGYVSPDTAGYLDLVRELRSGDCR